MTPKKPVDALMVADYLLYKAKKEGVEVSNKKLQKLLYYTQAWSVAIRNKTVFEDKIEAWVHGPAIKQVYLAYQQFGAKPIEKEVSEEVMKQIPDEAARLIDQVWNVYSKYDPEYLEFLTHSEKPWQVARQNLEPHVSSQNEITIGSMKEYYGPLVEKKS
jgi:uncharacterized phage-associated protein